jgi:hypothetical protein
MNITGRQVYQKGQKPAKVKAVRDAARDKSCKLRIPGVCRGDPATTVGNHMRFFGIAGAAQKPDDIFILDGCDRCHAILDSRDKWADYALGWDDVLMAFMFTLRDRRAAGLIKLKGE